MAHLYETHCHSSQASLCSTSTSRELVRAYHKAGYAGLVLTDHFIWGNTAVDRTLPWAQRMQLYYDAYLEAKDEARDLDFDVIFGIEHAYGDGKEVLIYGIDLDFLLNNPDIPEITLDELVFRVHSVGGIVIQAHPFRDRWYTNLEVPPRSDIVDGIEVYNACNYPNEDVQALELVRTGSYILTSGGDIHSAADERIGAAGILLPHRVHDERGFAQALKNNSHHLRIHGKDLAAVSAQDLA